jgi:hypothetical protein
MFWLSPFQWDENLDQVIDLRNPGPPHYVIKFKGIENELFRGSFPETNEPHQY